MKNLLLRLLLAASMLISTHAFSQSPEVALDLSGMPVSYADLRTQSQSFATVYQGIYPFLQRQWESVLYSEIDRVRENMNRSHGDRYFSGLRVLHGLTDNNRIILYYMPLYASYSSTIKDQEELFSLEEQSGDLDSAVLNTNLPVYYIMDNHFYNIRGDEMSTKEALANSGRYKRYVKTNISYSDEHVHSNFFAFQEIDALYTQNSGSQFGSDYIYFTSVTRREENAKYYHKQILSTRPPSSTFSSLPGGENIFYSMVANLAHSCPPNCMAVSYTVVQ